jgi:hypothetical protein
MKRLSFLLIIFSLSIIFSACPPLEEDPQDGISHDYSSVVTYDDKLDSYKWFEILDKIAREKRYVSLDLSKCTLDDDNEIGGLIKKDGFIVFDPFPASASGKDYIVSITLPSQTQVICESVPNGTLVDINDEKIDNAKKHSAFRSFSNLRSVKAENVTLIGNFAFTGCTALTEVNLPRVGHSVTDEELKQTPPGYVIDIGKYAFLGCKGLKEIKFNSAAVIGEYAFKDCTSLSKIDFPEVWMIENNAFEGCASLVNFLLEKASKINKEAFKGCTGLKNAQFNVNPIRFTSGEPITIPTIPDEEPVFDSVIFYPSVFTGCKSLEILNVRNAWNVYFSKDVLANTGSAIDIYLYDELSTAVLPTSYGHPQNAKFLGDGVTVTVKKVNIYAPVNEGNIQDFLAKNIRSLYPGLAEINVNKK